MGSRLPLSPPPIRDVSTPRTLAGPRRRARIVGRIRPLLVSESSSSSVVTVSREEDEQQRGALISFGAYHSAKEPYKLDWCYKEDEGMDVIFSKEIEPSLEGLFHGKNACIIAYGAEKSGKTRLLEGFDDNTGLVPMAFTRILSLAEQNGSSVLMSHFEVQRNAIYDILEPKGEEVRILEDSDGKIRLKGLSQIPIKSVSEFRQTYSSGLKLQESARKAMEDVPSRRHQGTIIYVSGTDSKAKNLIYGKIIIIDLAGYEEPKQNIARSDKSLFALLNVIYSFNANDAHIPYRESKLTRLMQDFMCKGSRVVMFACLSPVSCQIGNHACSKASRLCQAAIQRGNHSSKDNKRISKLDSFGTKSGVVLQHCSFEREGNRPTTMNIARCTPLLIDCTTLQAQPAQNPLSWCEPDSHHSAHCGSTGDAEKSATIHDDAVEDTNDQIIGADEEISDSFKPQENQLISPPQSSPPLSERIKAISNTLKILSTGPIGTPQSDLPRNFFLVDCSDQKTPEAVPRQFLDGTPLFEGFSSPQDRLKTRSVGLKVSLVKECLTFLNTANKESLMQLKGIGEKRASFILELRKENAEPFQEVNDLKFLLGLSTKQIKEMLTQPLGNF